MAKHIWRQIPFHFPHVAVDAFIVMPDHIHGILRIREPRNNNPADPWGRIGVRWVQLLVRTNRRYHAMYIGMAIQNLPGNGIIMNGLSGIHVN
jgi:hypothetical protein